MDSQGSFEVRRAEASDRERLFAVLSPRFPANMAARYEWMYQGNPHGPALSWLALETPSGKPVGCTSVFPRRVYVGGHVRLGSIGGDCFVDPAHRRRGIATALHRASLGGMRELGVEFMYGPPRPNNLAALLKAGSRVVTGFRKWVRPLSGRALETVLRRRPPLGLEHLADLSVGVLDAMTRGGREALTLEPVSSFGAEFDRFFEGAARAYQIVCIRDSGYLDWRYLRAPSRLQAPFAVRRRGEMIGFVALEVSGERAALTDFFTRADPSLFDATLEAVIDLVAKQGCSLLAAALIEGSAAERRLRRLGFLRRDTREFQVLAAPEDPQVGLLAFGDAWHFCPADEDMESVLRPERDERHD